MIEAIKNRPISQYYLWRICQNHAKDRKEETDILSVKQVIGQLKAERNNLERLNNQSIRYHISSLAFLEELLKAATEESFNQLMQDIQQIYGYKKQVE
ncbi:hypothetical protein [uncultured Enterococcus sp.]|uniref:hypothetical protein n=1 Tax=uncultured Enterococcus sp. TaxID=167972 RepID=UPI002AA85A0F|nr:hypothetical protein [uncultured Enterococcus sp.]